jgi:hypothetical protein
MYQRGLKERGLYSGEADGKLDDTVLRRLATCLDVACDPVPNDLQ